MNAAGRPSHRRLFFALWPDEATRESVQRATRAIVRHCGGAPVAAADLHLTLAFLGAVPVEQVEALPQAVRDCRLPALDLPLERLGYFAEARVLWIGPHAAIEPLARFVAALWQALAPLGLSPAPPGFYPHVTLARKVATAPRPVAVRPIAWPLDGFVLAESASAGRGARYQVVARFPALGKSP
jgi:2'-5' RNA ligase